jgi:hypothetical protein
METKEISADGRHAVNRDETGRAVWVRQTSLGRKLAAQRHLLYEEWCKHPEWRETVKVPW